MDIMKRLFDRQKDDSSDPPVESDTTDSPPPAFKIARHPEFEEDLRWNPDNIDAYLIYADWLQEQGDPRGELIVLQHRLLQNPKDEEAELAESRLMSKYEKYFTGGISQSSLQLTWRCGFVRSARLARYLDEDGSFAEMLTTLLLLPTTLLLSDLTLGMTDFSGAPGYDEVMPPLCGAEPRPPLRRLFLGDFEYPDESEMSWFITGDVSSIWLAFRDLERVVVQGGEFELGEIFAPNLRQFEVRTGSLNRNHLNSITNAFWPKLEKLEIWFGDSGYDAEGGIEDIRLLLDGVTVPELVHLGLKNAEFTNEICREIVRAPILRQLAVLDLSMGLMDMEGARILANNADALAHLQRLDVGRNCIPDEGLELLRELAPEVVMDGQKDPDDYYYVSVGE